MHPSHSPDKQTNINSPEPKIACNDEWQDFYQELHVFRTHLICTDHQLQALCSVFAELGLTPLQEFMHFHIFREVSFLKTVFPKPEILVYQYIFFQNGFRLLKMFMVFNVLLRR